MVDIGAGSGKLTTALAARGFDVTAVDPFADMLSQLSRRLPSVRVHLGTGEKTGMADHNADLVTFAQSWHWIEPTAGAAETTRILAPGGAVAMVWNFPDVRVDWVAELAETWHTLAREEYIDAARHRQTLGSPFASVDTLTVDWTHSMPLVDLAALVTTHSYYLTSPLQRQRQIRQQLKQLLTHRFPSEVTVGLPYRTHCYRRDASAERQPPRTEPAAPARHSDDLGARQASIDGQESFP